jgi:predicted ABC-type ATPase
VVVVAGPNGAGKSTTAPALVRDLLGVSTFVNADVIAQGLSGFDPNQVAVEAGRIMLRHLRELADQGLDFAFETTLASRTFAPWLRTLKERHGYQVIIFFLWLPTVKQAIARVKDRVSRGGHAVPDSVIRRRYHRGLTNFCNLYEPIADAWSISENSASSGPSIVALRDLNGTLEIVDTEAWEKIQRYLDD